MKGRSEIRGWDYWEGAKGWLDGVERKPVRATVRRPAGPVRIFLSLISNENGERSARMIVLVLVFQLIIRAVLFLLKL